MSRVKLDRIDRKILRDLQEKGRMSNVDLASNAGISAPPCLRRVRALEDANIIRGYHADINPSSLGYGVFVFAHVGLSGQSEADMKQFEELVDLWSMVIECHMISGEYDYMLKIVAEDWDQYQKFLTDNLASAPSVSHIKSFLGIRTAKIRYGVPVEVS